MAFVQQNWVSAASEGTISDVEEVPGVATYGWQTETSGSPTLVDLRLEGSIDGVAWFTIDRVTTAPPGLRWVADRPVALLRVNVLSCQGGSSPTATISVIAV